MSRLIAIYVVYKTKMQGPLGTEQSKTSEAADRRRPETGISPGRVPQDPSHKFKQQ